MRIGVGLSLPGVAVRQRLVPVVVTANLVYADSDSIVAPPGPTWFTIFAANNPSQPTTNAAVAGSTLANLVSRRQAVLDADPRVFVCAPGANDLDDTTTYPTVQSYFDAVVAYVTPIRAGGAKIGVGTVLERAGRPTINSRRAAYNALLKAAIGNQIDAVLDSDRTSVGAVGASADSTLIPDGTHPSANPGQIILSGPATGAINAMRGVANQPFQFTFTDASGVTASTVSTSNKVRVTGLNYQEGKTASVSGGEMRVTPFGGSAGSWGTASATVYEGEDIEVRGTANATANGTTDVVLTVGTTTDTYTITTANNLAPLTTTYRSAATVTKGYETAHDFTGVTYYVGKAYIILEQANGSVPAGVTIKNGSTTVGTGVLKASLANGGNKISVWEVPLSAGGAGTIAVTGVTGGLTGLGYQMWSTDANAAYVESKTLINYAGVDPGQAPSITKPAGGSILAGCIVPSGGTLTPTSGNTERFQAAENGDRYWAGDRATTGQVGLTGIQYTGGSILVVSIQPS